MRERERVSDWKGSGEREGKLNEDTKCLMNDSSFVLNH